MNELFCTAGRKGTATCRTDSARSSRARMMPPGFELAGIRVQMSGRPSGDGDQRLAVARRADPHPQAAMIAGIATLTIVESTMINATPRPTATSPHHRLL